VTIESTGTLLLKAVIIFAVIFALVPMLTVLERKLIGRFQARYGPNRVGPFGLFQPLADVAKLLSKEPSYPRTAVHWLMAIAPVISIFTAVATLAIIPFGPIGAWSDNYGLWGIDVPIGILYAFAFSSIAFYGFVIGGWASGSKYSFLGSMRSAAQLISYEVALGLSLLGVVMMAGTLSLPGIVEKQGEIWYFIPQIVGFLIFMVSGFAETARAPFDLPEADAEIVGGYNTEFGGMRLGSFLLAEYLHMVVFAGIATAMFLGGWHGPGPAWLDPIWVLLKMLGFILLFIWVRATMPRLRYDQLMNFGWKVLLPLATLNALVTAILVVVT
jgi:NADH-quinone oxidoreductase subunit H